MLQYHVVYVKDKQKWCIKRSKGKRFSAVCKTKKEAIEKGKLLAHNQKGELILHIKKTGKVQKKHYGKNL